MTPGLLGIIVGVVLGSAALAGLGIARARGRRPPDWLLGWSALVIYLVILWVYALAPAPEIGAVACRAPNLITFPNLLGVDRGPHGLMSDPSFQELVLNVALFVPLGTLLGLFFRRGIPSTILIGFLVSLTGELVQLTGSLGLYPCAYRQFSTEDVLLNTVGTGLGALVVWLARHRPWGPAWIDPESGRAGTSGRRVLAIAIDLGTVLVGAVASIVFYRLVLTTGLDRPFDVVNTASDAVLGFAVAVIAQAAVLVSTGMTIGEQIVDLRRRRRDRP